MSVDAKFIRDIDQYFKYPTDENPTTQQAYQEAVRNWVGTEEAIVDSHLWQPTTNYSEGNQVKTPSLPPQCVLVCTAAGTSGDGEPDYTNVDVGDSVTDGTVTWLVSEAIVGGDFVKTHAYGISTDKTFLNFYLNTSNPENAFESMQLNSGSLNIGGKALNNASNIFLDGTGNVYGYKTNGAFSLYCGSGNENPSMSLWGVNSSSNAGYFRLRATLNENDGKDLIGRPNGDLTWNGKHVPTTERGNYNIVFRGLTSSSTSTTYTMCMQWGSFSLSSSDTSKSITFTREFASTPVLVLGGGTRSAADIKTYYGGLSTTGFTVYASGLSTGVISGGWIAIGNVSVD